MKNQRPNKFCTSPHCREVIAARESYCKQHKRIKFKKEYNKQKDSKAFQTKVRFYNSKEWRRLRKLQLVQSPLCAIDDCNSVARVVDHISPIINASGEWQWQLAFNQNNLQSLCDVCHNKKRSKESREVRKAEK